jgi:rare lipoprotein A
VVADIGVAVGVIGRIGPRRPARRMISNVEAGSHVEAGKEFAPLYRHTFIAVALVCLAHSAKAESGYASYYGGRGHKGEMTCAHRTRPFGSVVTVTYAGHSIHCRINDRGPFVRGRVIDVSVSAARALGMMRSGVVVVLVE